MRPSNIILIGMMLIIVVSACDVISGGVNADFAENSTMTTEGTDPQIVSQVNASPELTNALSVSTVVMSEPSNTLPAPTVELLEQSTTLPVPTIMGPELPSNLRAPTMSPSVSIQSFTVSSNEVFAARLQQGTERVPVSWVVINRPPNSNLVFEQRLADSSLTNVELPRHNLIVASSGDGIVAPVSPGDEAEHIILLLSVVDLNSEVIYASTQMRIPINSDPDEGVTIFTDCFSDTFLPSNNLRIGDYSIVQFYPDSGGFHFVYTTRSSMAQEGVLRPDPLEIISGPFCFQRPDEDFPRRRWEIRYDVGLQGWVDEYVIWPNDTHWVFLANSYDPTTHVNVFSISDTEIDEGETISVTWDIDNTEYVSIFILNALGENPITENGDRLSPSGSVEIDANLMSKRNSVELRYPPGLVNTLVFEMDCTYNIIDPSVIDHPTCPQAPQTSQATYQLFEHGFMVWREGGIIATFTHDSANNGTFLDTYQEGDLLTYSSEPPLGLIAPERGFGTVWLAYPYLQDTLGWAVESEQSYMMTWQYDPTNSVYFTLPDGSYEVFTTYALQNE